MNAARQSRLVAARELRERGRSRAFLVSVVLMVVAVAGAIVLPAFLDTGGGTKNIGLTGSIPPELAATIESGSTAVGTTARLRLYDTVAAGEDAVRSGKVDVLVVDGRKLEWLKRADEQLKAVVTGAIQLGAVRDRAHAAGITPDQLNAVLAPIAVDNVELSQVAGRSPDDETAAFIMTLVLFGAISTYGAMVLSGVVEEKSSRTVEVLLARMPARNLLAGKIAGIGLLGLAQIVLIAIVAITAGAMVDSVNLPAVRASVIAWAVVWFIVGYALYATVFGTLGSLASRTEDASSVTGPITIVLIVGFMVSFTTIGSADTAWARFVSWFPVTSPLAMPNRIAMGAATWWDPLVALALAIGAIAGLVVLGGRIYTHAILHTGATLKLGDAWRGAVVSGEPKVSADRSVVTNNVHVSGTETNVKSNPSLRSLEAILIAVSAALALVTFALVNDAVIALAIAAGFYAIGSRAAKARHSNR